MICKVCGSNNLIQKVRPDTIHHAEWRCIDCNSFNGWVKKEENKDKRTKTSIHHQTNIADYCEMCLRTKQQLGQNETLELHHKVPIKYGGEDTLENLLVLCTYCHKEVHSRQWYLNIHLHGDIQVKQRKVF